MRAARNAPEGPAATRRIRRPWPGGTWLRTRAVISARARPSSAVARAAARLIRHVDLRSEREQLPKVASSAASVLKRPGRTAAWHIRARDRGPPDPALRAQAIRRRCDAGPPTAGHEMVGRKLMRLRKHGENVARARGKGSRDRGDGRRGGSTGWPIISGIGCDAPASLIQMSSRTARATWMDARSRSGSRARAREILREFRALKRADVPLRATDQFAQPLAMVPPGPAAGHLSLVIAPIVPRTQIAA